MVNNKLKSYYTVAVSQTISSDGKHLFVGTNFGEILLFSIENLTKDITDESLSAPETKIGSNTEPLQIFQASDKSQIYSLSFFNDFLIVGTNAEITGYSFKGQQISSKKAWEVRIPSSPENAELNEINCFWLDRDAGNLYAGCGDNNIYNVSLEDGKILRTFNGHTNYIHSVDGNAKSAQIVSASEDGSVRVWDARSRKSSSKIEPYKKDQLARPEFGKWQGTVAFNNDWLICGGGPRFSMWHLRSNEVTQVFDFPEKIHICGFLDDQVLVGGDYKTVRQYNFNGDLVTELPVSSPSIYSAVWQSSPHKLLCFGGSSNILDVCTNFNYRDICLKLHPGN
ncbi:THO complex subunit 6 [Culicoides brevitarsis]|uniref:THO complex subunit 6 n=1 Tax=Culicoides brevitarsis TaxID=469753 RepID=UPI00307B508F